MALTHCPHCGEPLIVAQPKRTTAIEPLGVDTRPLSTTAAFAYYKRTSARADLAFVLGLLPDLSLLAMPEPTRANREITFQRCREYINEIARARGEQPYSNDWLTSSIPQPWRTIAESGGFTRLTMRQRDKWAA